MAGKENLVPQNKRTKAEQSEIARQGGIASGEARRRKKTMREWAEMFGSLDISVKAPDGQKIDTDLDGAAMMAQYSKASRGDTRAARFIADLKGEMVQRVEHQGAPVVILPDSEAEAIKKLSR